MDVEFYKLVVTSKSDLEKTCAALIANPDPSISLTGRLIKASVLPAYDTVVSLCEGAPKHTDKSARIAFDECLINAVSAAAFNLVLLGVHREECAGCRVRMIDEIARSLIVSLSAIQGEIAMEALGKGATADSPTIQ